MFDSYFLNRRTARDEAEFKRKKIQQPCSTTPPKTSFSDNGKVNSPPTPTNDPIENTDT